VVDEQDVNRLVNELGQGGRHVGTGVLEADEPVPLADDPFADPRGLEPPREPDRQTPRLELGCQRQAADEMTEPDLRPRVQPDDGGPPGRRVHR
jgi:hypothetical protein